MIGLKECSVLVLGCTVRLFMVIQVFLGMVLAFIAVILMLRVWVRVRGKDITMYDFS